MCDHKNIKICMKLEEPQETLKIFEKHRKEKRLLKKIIKMLKDKISNGRG